MGSRDMEAQLLELCGLGTPRSRGRSEGTDTAAKGTWQRARISSPGSGSSWPKPSRTEPSWRVWEQRGWNPRIRGHLNEPHELSESRDSGRSRKHATSRTSVGTL